MTLIRFLIAITLAIGLSACSSKITTYSGPPVTSIQVLKGERKMYLMNNDKVLKKYKVALGFAPAGHKQFESDGRTPEGRYLITHHNPRSRYYRSLGISYPNEADIAYAESQGKEPGGDIFIHGRSNYKGINKGDWTAGCIAVKDKEMTDIYAMVRKDTPIYIMP